MVFKGSFSIHDMSVKRIVSLLVSSSDLITELMTFNFEVASGGYLHSCVTPYSMSCTPNSYNNSVALGRKETILLTDISCIENDPLNTIRSQHVNFAN